MACCGGDKKDSGSGITLNSFGSSMDVLTKYSPNFQTGGIVVKQSSSANQEM